jgi:hypothetical protein
VSRRKPAGLLGPDGKPIDRSKYAPKPEPERRAVQSEPPVEPAAPSYLDMPNALRNLLGNNPMGLFPRSFIVHPDALPKGPSLAERVANDLVALGIDTTETVPELPRPEPDLTSYADALEHAIKTCPHRDVTSTMYARGEYQCQDCRKYLSAADMRKRSSGLGGMFGFGW